VPVGTVRMRCRQGVIEGGEGLAGVGADAQARAVGFEDPGLGVDLDDPAPWFESELVGRDFAQRGTDDDQYVSIFQQLRHVLVLDPGLQ
jgi:hypothetical protein